MYLNTIYYGNGAYGIEAASITYFNKSASELTLNEAATLVGIPNSPTYYDPFANYEACKSRRNVVLSRMLSAGTITQEEYDATAAEEILAQPRRAHRLRERLPLLHRLRAQPPAAGLLL